MHPTDLEAMFFKFKAQSLQCWETENEIWRQRNSVAHWLIEELKDPTDLTPKNCTR